MGAGPAADAGKSGELTHAQAVETIRDLVFDYHTGNCIDDEACDCRKLAKKILTALGASQETDGAPDRIPDASYYKMMAQVCADFLKNAKYCAGVDFKSLNLGERETLRRLREFQQ